MLKRTITGTIIFILTALAILGRYLTPYIFDGFVLIIALFSGFEMVKLYKSTGKKILTPLVYAYPFLVWLVLFFFKTTLNQILYIVLVIILMFIICMFYELIFPTTRKFKEKIKKDTALNDNSQILSLTTTTMSIIFYPLTLIITLFAINSFALNTGTVALILAFLIAIFTDIFAYFFGITIKGVKLCPTISPKKSVAGAVFGILGGIIAALLCWWLFYSKALLASDVTSLTHTGSLLLFLGAGVFGTIISQFGDLVASAIKRRAGAKDFGSVFPGHGGFMDRIDSIIFTSAFVYIVFCIFII